MTVRDPLLALAAGACLILAGCATDTRRVAAPSVAPVAAASASVATGPRSAVDAALARGSMPAAGTQGSTSALGTPDLRADAPARYTVKTGDTLWDISTLYLQDPWRWPELWRANPDIKNPHLIYPGDILVLVTGMDGLPGLLVERAAAGGAGLGGRGAGTDGVVRVEPMMRSEALGTPIATLPAEAIAGFLGKPRLLSREQVRSAAYVAALADGHATAGAPQTVYVRGLRPGGPTRFNVVRLGEAVEDPATGRHLGHMAIHTGVAGITRVGATSTGQLLESVRETLVGDLLVPIESEDAGGLQPRPAPAGVEGQVAAVVDGVTLIGQYQVVAVNRGRRDGLEAGHVLSIESVEPEVRDTSCGRRLGRLCLGSRKLELPRRHNGSLLVFRAEERMSYALTVSVSAPVKLGDYVITP
ncbi:MAG: hypothetical protein RL026_772 [Pseudomonadota bacterium]